MPNNSNNQKEFDEIDSFETTLNNVKTYYIEYLYKLIRKQDKSSYNEDIEEALKIKEELIETLKKMIELDTENIEKNKQQFLKFEQSVDQHFNYAKEKITFLRTHPYVILPDLTENDFNILTAKFEGFKKKLKDKLEQNGVVFPSDASFEKFCNFSFTYAPENYGYNCVFGVRSIFEKVIKGKREHCGFGEIEKNIQEFEEIESMIINIIANAYTKILFTDNEKIGYDAYIRGDAYNNRNEGEVLLYKGENMYLFAMKNEFMFEQIKKISEKISPKDQSSNIDDKIDAEQEIKNKEKNDIKLNNNVIEQKNNIIQYITEMQRQLQSAKSIEVQRTIIADMNKRGYITTKAYEFLTKNTSLTKDDINKCIKESDIAKLFFNNVNFNEDVSPDQIRQYIEQELNKIDVLYTNENLQPQKNHQNITERKQNINKIEKATSNAFVINKVNANNTKYNKDIVRKDVERAVLDMFIYYCNRDNCSFNSIDEFKQYYNKQLRLILNYSNKPKEEIVLDFNIIVNNITNRLCEIYEYSEKNNIYDQTEPMEAVQSAIHGIDYFVKELNKGSTKSNKDNINNNIITRDITPEQLDKYYGHRSFLSLNILASNQKSKFESLENKNNKMQKLENDMFKIFKNSLFQCFKGNGISFQKDMFEKFCQREFKTPDGRSFGVKSMFKFFEKTILLRNIEDIKEIIENNSLNDGITKILSNFVKQPSYGGVDIIEKIYKIYENALFKNQNDIKSKPSLGYYTKNVFNKKNEGELLSKYLSQNNAKKINEELDLIDQDIISLIYQILIKDREKQISKVDLNDKYANSLIESHKVKIAKYNAKLKYLENNRRHGRCVFTNDLQSDYILIERIMRYQTSLKQKDKKNEEEKKYEAEQMQKLRQQKQEEIDGWKMQIKDNFCSALKQELEKAGAFQDGSKLSFEQFRNLSFMSKRTGIDYGVESAANTCISYILQKDLAENVFSQQDFEHNVFKQCFNSEQNRENTMRTIQQVAIMFKNLYINYINSFSQSGDFVVVIKQNNNNILSQQALHNFTHVINKKPKLLFYTQPLNKETFSYDNQGELLESIHDNCEDNKQKEQLSAISFCKNYDNFQNTFWKTTISTIFKQTLLNEFKIRGIIFTTNPTFEEFCNYKFKSNKTGIMYGVQAVIDVCVNKLITEYKLLNKENIIANKYYECVKAYMLEHNNHDCCKYDDWFKVFKEYYIEDCAKQIAKLYAVSLFQNSDNRFYNIKNYQQNCYNNGKEGLTIEEANNSYYCNYTQFCNYQDFERYSNSAMQNEINQQKNIIKYDHENKEIDVLQPKSNLKTMSNNAVLKQ